MLKSPQSDPNRTRRQRNGANTFRLFMIVAWLVVAIFMTVQAFAGKEKSSRDLNIFLAIVAYAMFAFLLWIEVRRWRREKRIKQALAEKEKKVPSGQS